MDPSYSTTRGFLGLVLLPQTPSAPTRCSGPSTLRGKPLLRVRRGLGIEAPKHFHPATALGIPIGSIAYKEADAGLMKIGLGEELGTPSWPSHLFGDWRFRRYAPILRDSFYNSFSPSLLSAETIFHTQVALSSVPLANPSGTYSPVMTLPGPGLSGEQYFRAKIFPNAVLPCLAWLGWGRALGSSSPLAGGIAAGAEIPPRPSSRILPFVQWRTLHGFIRRTRPRARSEVVTES